MARTVTEIFDEIISTKEADAALAGLTSSSATSIWRLWAYITAVVLNIHENLFDLFTAEVDAKIASQQSGTPSWYVSRVKEFQLGDQVQVIDGVVTYPVVDELKQIVTLASYAEGAGAITLKIAKGAAGSEAALTAQELSQVENYMERIKFAGTDLTIVSNNADTLELTAEVFYDGINDPAIIQANVEAAITNYLRNIDFDGKVYVNKIIDAITAVDGVLDVEVTDATANAGGATPFTRVYQTVAGYIVEADSPNDFATLITYTPQNV